jgi:hypothetical protein
MAPGREFGRRQHQPQSSAPQTVSGKTRGGESGIVSMIKLAAIGFVLAGAAVGGWTMLGSERLSILWAFASTPELRSLLPGNSGNRLDFSSNRIGRSSTAPVLELCVSSLRFDNGAETEWEPALILQMLEAGNTQAVGLRVLGKPKKSAELKSAQYWGVLADCVFQQDASRLCDIDSRALAVQSATTFLREADRIAAEPEDATSYETQNLKSTRDRVTDGLRQRLRSGVLIAADFGSLLPASIRDALNDTKPLENACARK